ncbi:MAG: MFS transporter [Micromonosporaceae bacterium]
MLTATALAFTMVVPSLMQFALGALGPLLTAEFDLSRSDLGLVTGFYYLAAAVFSPLMGRWVGFFGARVATALTVVLSIAGAASFAASGNLVWVVVSVLIGGAAGAMANPATNFAISALPQPHAMLIGVKQSGVQVGALLAGAALPSIALAFGWQAAFLACCAVGVVGVSSVAVMPATARHRPPKLFRRSAVDVGRVTWLSIYSALVGAGMATINTYLVLYAHEKAGISLSVAGAMLAALAVCAVLSRIASAMFVEAAASAVPAGIRMLRWMALVGFGSTVAIGLAELIGPTGLWLGATGVGFSAAAMNGVANLVVIRTAKAGAVGHASGRMQGSFFGGLLLGPPVFGWLVDSTGRYAVGWGLTAVCFAAAAVVASAARVRRAADAAALDPVDSARDRLDTDV